MNSPSRSGHPHPGAITTRDDASSGEAHRAIAVDPRPPPAAPQNPPPDANKRADEFRNWLMLLASLAATVTFTAGHAPPGGFWSADDTANGYVAGTSVMRDKFRCRYLVFYYSNSAAFFLSLAVIVMLAHQKKETSKTIGVTDHVIAVLVSACIASLGTSYIAGSWDSPVHGMVGTSVFAIVLSYMWMHCWILSAVASTKDYVVSKIGNLFPANTRAPAATNNCCW